MNLIPVCVGDTLIFAFNIYSNKGIIDINSI